jgi:hypothetical protein
VGYDLAVRFGKISAPLELSSQLSAVICGIPAVERVESRTGTIRFSATACLRYL